MKIKAILAGTAIATLALTAAPQLGAPSFATQAAAAVDVSIGIFYDRLDPHGDWVSYRDQYVFIPSRVEAGWRPYTLGHWVYTKRYGWTWVSDEPFGWATYHYGRWGYAEEIGWYWVPGRRWAPAWVSWRRSSDYVVWAPLPPSRGGDVDISISIEVGDIPDYYWVAVPTRRFLAPDLRVVAIHDTREIREVVQRTEFIGTPRITNNIVVNNVIDVNVIAQETGQEVRAVEVKTTDDPAAAKASADQVTVFQGEIQADAEAKPPQLSDLSKVKKVKRKDADAGQTTDAPDAAGSAAPADGSTTSTAPASEPAADEADTSAPGGKKTTDEAATPDAAGEQPAQAEDQSTTKKKPRKQQKDKAAAPDAAGEQPVQAEDQSTTKNKPRKQQGGDEATGSTTPAPSQQGDDADAANADEDATSPASKTKKKGTGKKDQACDPSADPNCAPAE